MAVTRKKGFAGELTWWGVLCLCWAWSAGPARAQETQKVPVPDAEGVTTLHVYTNLAQVPVMVLGPNRERLSKEIAPNRFSLSIDSGPWFTASHVHQEGDEPLDLAILLDLHGNTLAVAPKIEAKLAGLAPVLLHQTDHVTVYGLDCTLTRGPKDQPAEEKTLARLTELALYQWEERTKPKPAGRCLQHEGLVQALTTVVSEVSTAPGRRVIVALTDGQDDSNRGDWTNLTQKAQIASAPIYGVVLAPAASPLPSYTGSARRDDPFTTMCDLSGGMMTRSNPQMKDVLEGLITTFRERYIVEFPRPSNSTAGRHSMEVRVEKSNDFIRTAGIAMPLPDAAVLADPNTILVGPTNTPVQGEQRKKNEK